MEIQTHFSCFCLFCLLSSSSVCSDDRERIASAEESQLCQCRSAILDGTRQKEISSLEWHAPNYKIGWQPAATECPLPWRVTESETASKSRQTNCETEAWFYHHVRGEEGTRPTKTDTQPQSWARGALKQEHHWKGPGTRPCAQRYECESLRIALIKRARTVREWKWTMSLSEKRLQGQQRRSSGRTCVCASTRDQPMSLVLVLPVDPVFSFHVYS